MARDGRDSRSQGFLPPGLLTARATIVLATATASLILAAAILLTVFGQQTYIYYLNDPVQTLQADSPLVGLVSQIGILLTWGSAAICVFAGVFVARSCGWRRALPLVALGVGVGYLALDDLFLIHEDRFPTWLGVSEELVQVVYGFAACLVLWRFRAFLRENEWPLLAVALVALATSFVLDFDDRASFRLAPRGVEDSFKLFGLAFLAAYLVRLSARMLVDAYPVIWDRRTAPHAEIDSPDDH